MLTIDLHTHSFASPDGSITQKQYEEIITKRIVDVVAITDHNRIDVAQKLRKKLGNHVIVGEEIMTQDGEIIGLFLSSRVQPYQSIATTIQSIHAQGGLVYIPHPFDSFRKGIGEKALEKHIKGIDCIEGFNGRMMLRWQNSRAEKFAKHHGIIMAASSDAHSREGIGETYTMVEEMLDKQNAQKILQSATVHKKYQPWQGYLSPLCNKIHI